MGVSEIIMEGLTLMVLGMGTVFIFLAVMVVSVILMSKLAQCLEGDLPDAASADGVPVDHIAAIAAAVRHYRSKHSS